MRCAIRSVTPQPNRRRDEPVKYRMMIDLVFNKKRDDSTRGKSGRVTGGSRVPFKMPLSTAKLNKDV